MSPAGLLATCGGIGLLRPAPGTWASAAALPFAWLLATWGGTVALVAGAAVVFAIGCWAAGAHAREVGIVDPRRVVIDEVAGQWIALAVAPPDPLLYVAGFVLFRVCDIFKPWPASLADRRVGGGFGIMLDDAIAGLYAAILLYLISSGIGR